MSQTLRMAVVTAVAATLIASSTAFRVTAASTCALGPIGEMHGGDQKADVKDQDAKNTKTLLDKDKNAKVDLAVGDRLLVKLSANPTTGYTWVMASKESDQLRLTGKPSYERDDKDKKAVGGGGTMTFTFTAAAPGEIEVDLHYLRTFEKDKKADKTFSFTVRIK